MSLQRYIGAKYKPEGKVTVLENAVDLDIFKPVDSTIARNKLGLPELGFYIGTAGALHRDRDVGTLYRAFEILSNEYPDVRLLLAGPLNESISLPDMDRVHYLGNLDYHMVPLFFNSLNVGVICNKATEFRKYCFPQKAYEMIACGIPVISANVGSMARLLSGTNSLYDSEDPQSLVTVIKSKMHPSEISRIKCPSWRDQGKVFATMLKASLDQT